MIEGLKVTIQGGELKMLCELRSEYEYDRARFYEGKVAALEGVDLEAKMSGGNPVEQLRSNADTHKQQGDELRFTADHIDLRETYLLDRGALQTLGIVKRRW